MKILYVITGVRKAAGTTTFVENVMRGLQFAGQEVDIAMSTSALKKCDVIHIHGLWGRLLHNAAKYAKKNGIPIVWSTHGMTAPWAMRHKWWKKLPAWLLYQKHDLRSAAAIHCTTELEVAWNKALGFKNCFIAPLGTHLPNLGKFNSLTSGHNSKRTLLFVGRIYPVKGLVNLIKAWNLVQSQGPNSQGLTIPFSNSILKPQLKSHPSQWKLRIVGPDQAGHQARLESLVREVKLGDSVEFAGPKFGEELSAEYANCDCLVLPSFTENFGATIVDALAHGKPCIASTFTPWRELKDYGCGWWVSNEPELLGATIQEMILLDDSVRHRMGARGRMLVEKKYSWDAVVMKLEDGYKEVLK